MSVVITVRNVPDAVRDELAGACRACWQVTAGIPAGHVRGHGGTPTRGGRHRASASARHRDRDARGRTFDTRNARRRPALRPQPSGWQSLDWQSLSGAPLRGSVVCDASAVVALSLDSGPDGRWAADTLSGSGLRAPSLIMVECSNVIRRHELTGLVSADQAAQAHADLLDLEIGQWPAESYPAADQPVPVAAA